MAKRISKAEKQEALKALGNKLLMRIDDVSS